DKKLGDARQKQGERNRRHRQLDAGQRAGPVEIIQSGCAIVAAEETEEEDAAAAEASEDEAAEAAAAGEGEGKAEGDKREAEEATAADYQKLLPEEVFGLYEAITHALSIPLCVYDNPATTQFVFSDELHGQIAQLPNVASIKIPGVPEDPLEARSRVERLRAQIPSHITVGISGDGCAANGLNAGCDAWYSVIGGVFPTTALAITRAAQAGNAQEATRLSERLQPLWALFSEFGGSLRVVAAAAQLQGLVEDPCLPLPLKALNKEGRQRLGELIDELGLS
ncbi:hypothetical protein LCGC14_2006530, partial [marine sediment metagenome]